MGKEDYIFLLVSFCSVLGQAIKSPEVQLNNGIIKGLRSKDNKYSMYLGMPYAKINEDNPFGPAIPYEIEGVFEAYNDSIMCPQVPEHTDAITSLDCLHVHVYVPASAHLSDKLLPVMVYIHGGLFQMGSGNRVIYDPTYLMKHDVIIVTMNYRVSVYGFMCLDQSQVSGNQGLKDQYLAIKWVKENIQAFRGDSNQITLFGQSAGGHAVDLHLRSDREPLFNKAILQSGSAEALTVLFEPDREAPLKIAKYIGLETDDIKEALSYLTKTEPNVVASAAIDLNIKFKPCVEKVYEGEDPFISSPWIDAEIPHVNNMPILMGFNKLESASFSKRDDKTFYNWTIINDSISQVFYSDQNIVETKDLVSRYYVGDNVITPNVKWGAIRFSSDFTYIHPVQRTLKKYLENNAGPVYLYMFSYIGGRNYVRKSDYDMFDATGNSCCTSHNDDVAYIFNPLSRPAPTEADKIVIKRLTAMWTNFAKYGNPTPEINELLQVEWKPFTLNEYHFLDINSELVPGTQPLADRMAFWDLFFAVNKKSLKFTRERYRNGL